MKKFEEMTLEEKENLTEEEREILYAEKLKELRAVGEKIRKMREVEEMFTSLTGEVKTFDEIAAIHRENVRKPT